MHIAAERKINSYRQQYAENQNISLLPAIVSTSTHMHGEFLRLLFLQANGETEAHFNATGMPSQRNQSDSFRSKRAAFCQSLKSKVGLVAAKAAALARFSSHALPFFSPPSFHTLSLSHVHWCVVVRLVHTNLGLSYLITHVLHYPPPTRTTLY